MLVRAMVEPSPTPMIPMSLERMTVTGRSGILDLRASAAKNPALPPPRTMMRSIRWPDPDMLGPASLQKDWRISSESDSRYAIMERIGSDNRHFVQKAKIAPPNHSSNMVSNIKES